jgi:polysaccharide pyruvyl transferase WcaK-like protein
MNVPMIAVSYDPKINSFMHSLEMKAMCSVIEFKSDFFIEEFERTLRDKDAIKEKIGRNVARLIEKLDTNEEMIKSIKDGKNV